MKGSNSVVMTYRTVTTKRDAKPTRWFSLCSWALATERCGGFITLEKDKEAYLCVYRKLKEFFFVLHNNNDNKKSTIKVLHHVPEHLIIFFIYSISPLDIIP